MIQNIFISVYAGGLGYGMGRKDLTDIINWHAVTGLFFFLAINSYNIAVVPTSVFFPLDRNVFLKEKRSQLYTIAPYFISKNLVDLPYTFLFPLISSLIFYWLLGLSNTPEQFFTFLLIHCLLVICGTSAGLLIGSIIIDMKTINTMISMTSLPLIVFAGYYKNINSLPDWIGWVQFLSPIKYGFGAFVQNEVQFTQNSNLGLLNLNVGLWNSIGLMCLIGISLRFLSFVFLWLRFK